MSGLEGPQSMLEKQAAMEMTSRERVGLCFAHREPDRPPLWCGLSPDFEAGALAELGLDSEGFRIRLGDDFRRVSAPCVDSGAPLSEGSVWRSPFGVERHGLGYGQPTTHPLAGNLTPAALENYPWPDPERVDISRVRADAAAHHDGYAILGGDWSPFWHDAIDLAGMENLYFLMYDEPELAHLLLGRIVDFYFRSSERIFEEAGDLVDIFFIGNDFGSQTGPLLGKELFDRFMAPQLRRLADLGHRYGQKVMLHCCGGIRPLIPSMIEAGIDALHALQPDCTGMDPAGLKRDFGEALVLNGAIDSKSILINGTPETVRTSTQSILDIMAPGGGYIAGASHDYILPETPAANLLAMCDAIRDYRR